MSNDTTPEGDFTSRMPGPRTETQALEQRITQALETIRREWGHMLPVGPAPIRYGTGKQSRITADDHAATTTDIDATTRLVSLRRQAVDTLNGWTRVIMEDRPVTKALPDGQSATSMATFLERHAQWVSGHEAAPDMAEEVEALAREVKRTTSPEGRDWITLGTCPIEMEVLDDEDQPVMAECGGQVRAWPLGIEDPTIKEQRKAKLPTCQRCGLEADVHWWYREMYGQHGVSHLVTVDELIGVIAVRLEYVATRDQVRQWKHRGKITTAGKDSKGRTLYRHDTVVDAIADDIARERMRRGKVGAS